MRHPAGGSNLLVPSAGVVVGRSHGGGTGTRLRRTCAASGEPTGRLRREHSENLRILCRVPSGLHVEGDGSRSQEAHCSHYDRTRDPQFGFRRKVLLGTAGILAVAVPLVFGLQQTPEKSVGSLEADSGNIPNLKFEVASIKQDKSGDGQRIMMRIMNPPNDGRFYATNVNLKMLLRMAYNLQDSQIVGGPNWLNSEP